MTTMPETEAREKCTHCGMVANVDPSEHAERYGHTPRVRRDEDLLDFDFTTYAFTKSVPESAVTR